MTCLVKFSDKICLILFFGGHPVKVKLVANNFSRHSWTNGTDFVLWTQNISVYLRIDPKWWTQNSSVYLRIDPKKWHILRTICILIIFHHMLHSILAHNRFWLRVRNIGFGVNKFWFVLSVFTRNYKILLNPFNVVKEFLEIRYEIS